MPKSKTYEEFVAKFKPKLTTDDCYTPPVVYDCVLQYVNNHVCPLDGHRIVRPFYPGGDFEHFNYQEGDIVLDNPPFSILARIVDFYLDRGILFWLFAPALTLFSYGGRERVTCVCSHCEITYENGAAVKTSFLTDFYPRRPAFVVEGELNKRVKQVQTDHKADKSKPLLKFPAAVVTSALLGKIAERGIHLECPRSEAFFIRKLDSGKQFFGGGFILSERMTAERMAAEHMAARKIQVFELSERERAIQAVLH